MLDIKEIKCFVTCAQTGSFSKTAEVLFTTQSSVSKTIKAMEEELKVELFERMAKGIRMTPEAERMYPYALQVMENIQKMRPLEESGNKKILSVSFNPSSWFADYFLKFYEMRREADIHYQIHSAGCREIVNRVREREDDIGFVYVVKSQLPAFQFFLVRNYLEFTSLKETSAAIYYGAQCKEKNEASVEVDFSHMKLIQRFPDEFSPDNYWNITDDKGQTAAEAETVITTNSDYIMERALLFGDLVNISGGYLAGKPQREIAKGHQIENENAKVVFGYVKRKGENLSVLASEFLEFLEESLK